MLRLLPIPLVLLCVACSPVADIGSRALVVQGRYEPMTCEQIAAFLTMYKAKADELTGAMNKSAQEASGHLVNAAVHWPTLTETRGHIRELEQARADKKCEGAK